MFPRILRQISPASAAAAPRSGNAASLGQGYCTAGIQKSPMPDLEIPENVPLPHHVMADFPKFGDKVALVRNINLFLLTSGRGLEILEHTEAMIAWCSSVKLHVVEQ